MSDTAENSHRQSSIMAFLRGAAFRRLALFGLAALALLIAARFFPVLEWLEHFRLWAKSLGFLGVILFGGVFAAAGILFLPCLPFTLLAGFTFGLGGGLGAVMLGIMLGAAAGFLIARYLARESVARQLANYPRFHAIDRAIEKEGWKIVALLRMCPVPFGLSNYLYGLTAIPFWPYMAATFAGMLPGNIMFVYLGTIGKKTAEGPRDPLEFVAAGLALVAVIAVTILIRRMAQRATARAGVELTPPHSCDTET